MKKTKRFELPETLRGDLKKAKKLEYITIVFLITVVILMYLVMGASQAMKTAWVEDMLGLIAPIGFLIGAKIADKPPTRKFLYGYHRVNSIAFLVGAVTLLAIGAFLVFDALSALFKTEYPTINSINLFGKTIWLGWLMIAVLLYSAIPAIFLGLKKLPLAKKLHNKTLFVDAKTNKADYMTAGAACLGILGIGFGLWWADAVAALIISVDITHDGYVQTKSAVTDLMNRTPRTVDEKKFDPLIYKVQKLFNDLDWAASAEVRFREEGQVYFGEAIIVPKEGTTNIVEKTEEANKKAHELSWRIFDLTINVVRHIPEDFKETLPHN